MAALHWLDTYAARIVPSLTSIFGIFLMRQFMQSLPDELLDAARIDGCGEFGVFSRIALPMIVVFLFMQRQFIEGMTAGAVKE